jgi:uncharacterized Fe-S center protein
LPDSCMKEGLEAGSDKFRTLYPKTDWTIQLAYAEQLGLGSREYTLVQI